jgi:hypothetical protein
MLDQAAGEKGRAGQFWGAAWGLLVLDDSPGAGLEYVNGAAAAALDSSYLDLFGVEGHGLVGGDATSQVGGAPGGVGVDVCEEGWVVCQEGGRCAVLCVLVPTSSDQNLGV